MVNCVRLRLALGISVCVIILNFLLDLLHNLAQAWMTCCGLWIVLSLLGIVNNAIDNAINCLIEVSSIHVGNVIEIKAKPARISKSQGTRMFLFHLESRKTEPLHNTACLDLSFCLSVLILA